MKLKSMSSARATKVVTRDKQVAGLVYYSPKDIVSGKAEGLVVSGGPKEGVWCAPIGKHGVVVGRTGCGKTRSCYGPTVLINATRRHGVKKPNMVIVDSKNTMLNETEAYLVSQGYRTRVLSLADENCSGRWNPLSSAYKAVKVGDVTAAERFISNLKAAFVAMVSSSKDAYWENTAWEAIAGVALALCMTEKKEPSLGHVFDVIHDEFRMKELRIDLGKDAPQSLSSCIALMKAERTWSCILSEVDTMLAFYTSAVGRIVASATNMDFVEELFGDEPVAYYLIAPDTSRLGDGYVTQFVESLTKDYMAEFEARQLEGTSDRSLMLVWDEFARFPKCPYILGIMSAARSRNLTCYLSLQSFSQFMEADKYTRDEGAVVLEQASVNVYMANTSGEVAEDARLKSGDIVGSRQLVHLPVGDAYVVVAGKPMVKTHMAPVHEYVRLLRPQKRRKAAA